MINFTKSTPSSEVLKKLEEDEREKLKRSIRKGLNKKSAFTAFKRQIIKDTDLYEEFKEYMK